MKRLTCEMCGSTDLIKHDGVFVCQSCGVKYSVEEARKLMVEVEGKVDVSGSTVKIDKSNEVDNLLTIARRARDEGNYGRAANNYDEILKIQPNNWEANFYRSYCSALEGRIIDIPANLKVTSNTALSTINMLLKEQPVNEAACSEIIVRMGAMSTLAIQNYYDLYSKNPEWTEHEYDKYGFSQNEFTHNKGNYMQLQENIDGVITTIGSFFGSVGAIEKVPSQICQLMVDMLETEKEILESFPQNPFAKEGLKYRQFYNLLANRTGALFTKINKTKELMGQIRDKHVELEAIQKEKEAEKQKEEDKIQLARYWKEHPSEKAKLESQKKDITNKIALLDQSITPNQSKIKELEAKKTAKTPAELELESLNNKYDQLMVEKRQLGLFKRKERQALQIEIDAISARLSVSEQNAAKERLKIERQIDQEIKPLQEKLKPLLNQKETLIKEQNRISYELTHEETELADFDTLADEDMFGPDKSEHERTENNSAAVTFEDNRSTLMAITPAILSAEEKLHIQNLEGKRKSGTVQEDFFLEDMKNEKSLRQLLKLWETYDFDELYPSVDLILRNYREKEKRSIDGLPQGTFTRIKDELSSLFGEKKEKEQIEEFVAQEKEEKAVFQKENLYCEKCRIITSGPKCARCGNKKIRKPSSADICFLAEKGQVAANILEDELKQANIPYTARSRQGAGITMTLGNALETFRFYVQYKDLLKAKEIDGSIDHEETTNGLK